jgi:endogenous inhibitor of DNA gyrase (YacG/DUF329 family)
MGSQYEAYCRCGFTTEVTVGGSRSGFLEDSGFPFSCAKCGIVDVNVAKLEDDVYQVICPQCGTDGCTQYGVPPASLHDLRPKSWLKRLISKEDQEPQKVHIQWGDRQASQKGHRCPSCNEMTLEFSQYPTLMFD